LLSMAKIEAGRMEVAIEPTSVADLIEGISRIMAPQATAKSIRISTDVEPSLPTLETDPGKVQQILYNLVSNAIKFTPTGGTVSIAGRRMVEGTSISGIELVVSDTGPGIPVDMQDLIFEKFRQVDASHTREHAGTGLGLAICKELAEMLQATITLDPSTPGATFCLRLPVTYEPPKPRSLMDSA